MASDMVEILLVEDDPDSVELTLYALRQRNVTNPIRVAVDGQKALDVIFGSTASDQRRRPRVILLDLKLPIVDGLEVLRRIRADPRTRSLPVVVMTSSRDERDLVESHRLGVDGYMVKPVDFDQFARMVVKLGLYWTVLSQPPTRSVA